MDIIAVEFLCCVAAAYEQLDRGNDLQLLTQVTESLRALEPQHHLLPELERKIARLAQQVPNEVKAQQGCPVRELQRSLGQVIRRGE